MKIVVNTRLLISDQLSGIGWFSYHTLQNLVKQNPEHEFVFLFDRKFDKQFIFGPNIVPEVINPPTRHPFLWYIWLEHSIIKTVRKHKPDIFFSPDGYLSTRLSDIPSIPVIHDINFCHDIKSVPYLHGKFWRYYFPKYMNMASRILTVSEFSKNDISNFYKVPIKKIDVVYNGVDETFIPIKNSIKVLLKKQYTHGEDFFIYVGMLLPRKNITRMVQAFNEFKKSTLTKIKLVIVGDMHFMSKEMIDIYNKSPFKNDIIFTGRLEPDELKKIMAAAKALLLVSCFEGFGIPIIEAMSVEIPVITSNITSMPEIAGDAAFLVNPFSIDSIKDAMIKVSNDVSLQKELVNKGRIQRKKFNWNETAKNVWNCILKVYGERN